MSLDARVAALEGRAVVIESALAENTKLTKEVLDTLKAFKMLGTLAKWGTAVSALTIGLWHGIAAGINWLKTHA